ncbi:MAG: AraC family ligand binding domain-containing protein, partial [Victivallales bacterium]
MQKIIWKNFTSHAQKTFAARTELSGATQVPVHTHDFPELFWIEAGTVEHEINGKKVLLKANDLVMLSPEDIHGFNTMNGKLVSFMNIAFCPDILKTFSARYFSGKKNFWRNPDAGMISMSRPQIDFLRASATKLAEAPDSAFEMDFFVLSLFKEIGYRENRLDFSRCPEWLKNSCEKMKFPGNFARGVPGLN